MAFKFEYSEHMKEYRKENKIDNTIIAINPLSPRQLKRKYPKFTLDNMTSYGIISQVVNTKQTSEGVFQVLDGYGQLTDGLISVVRE